MGLVVAHSYLIACWNKILMTPLVLYRVPGATGISFSQFSTANGLHILDVDAIPILAI
jgi:hypothetical protein